MAPLMRRSVSRRDCSWREQFLELGLSGFKLLAKYFEPSFQLLLHRFTFAVYRKLTKTSIIPLASFKGSRAFPIIVPGR